MASASAITASRAFGSSPNTSTSQSIAPPAAAWRPRRCGTPRRRGPRPEPLLRGRPGRPSRRRLHARHPGRHQRHGRVDDDLAGDVRRDLVQDGVVIGERHRDERQCRRPAAATLSAPRTATVTCGPARMSATNARAFSPERDPITTDSPPGPAAREAGPQRPGSADDRDGRQPFAHQDSPVGLRPASTCPRIRAQAVTLIASAIPTP